MFLLLALSSGTVLGFVSVAVALHRAPQAYEDENGFHLLRQRPLSLSPAANSRLGFTRDGRRDWLFRRRVSNGRDGSVGAGAPLGQPAPRRA
jgi:hypothetical protein